ncbi:MAG TPA: hypothetical protein VLA89_01985, partial [Gemmatimonadales bacterium]|nr:hypothetical protein [Gemmatimonadales bacterium]
MAHRTSIARTKKRALAPKAKTRQPVEPVRAAVLPERPTTEFSIKPPGIPLAFHKLLKVVAIVDGQDPLTRQLLDHIAAERYEIEVTDRFDRDVSEDAEVGAYIALI